jgi:putative tricarboxylic transport membrane protein
LSPWLAGFEAVFTAQSLVLMLVGVLVGIVVGALPGLTATMGVAVLLPFTFALDPVPGMMLLLGLYGSALYSGSIPAVLIRTPGTPSAAATVIDAYPMAQQGRAGQALTISLVTSVVGGMVGVVMLALLAPILARFALSFGPAEYFMLSVFALTIIASLAEGALVKGFVSGLLGLAIATIGLDPIQAYPRFSFGLSELSSSIQFIPVLIGLFGVAEALTQYERLRGGADVPRALGRFSLSLAEWRKLTPSTLWSTVIGFIIGVIPGTGGDIGAFVAYNETKRFARGDKRSFGRGDPRGVAAAEAANNSSTAGALAPTLTLGIPGDSVTAILIGAITVHGLRPGPQLFTGRPDLVYGIFIGFFVVNALILVVGLAGTRLWIQMMRVPTRFLWPTVLVLSVVGSYALRSSSFDVLVMLLAGILGYFMLKGGYPVAPLVIGVILGPIAESGFRRAMIISGGSYDWLLQPIPLILLVLTVISLTIPLLRARGGTAS